MLAPKEAIMKARTYLGDILPDFAKLDPKVEEMRLENGQCWKITFCVIQGDDAKADSLADLLRRHRIWKVVSVTSDDGSLIAVENSPF